MAGKLERPMFRDQSYSKLLSPRYVVHSSSQPKVCTDIPPKFYLCVSRSRSCPAPGFSKCILLSSMNNGSYKSWPPTRQAPESWEQCCSQAEAPSFHSSGSELASHRIWHRLLQLTLSHTRTFSPYINSCVVLLLVLKYCHLKLLQLALVV